MSDSIPSNLVALLRRGKRGEYGVLHGKSISELFGEAADEIERLIGELETRTATAKGLMDATSDLSSAVVCLQEIAALKGTSKRQKVNCEIAIGWLTRHGYPLETNAYVPGKGWRDTDETTVCPDCGKLHDELAPCRADFK